MDSNIPSNYSRFLLQAGGAVNATYRDGALHPETPLGLPENSTVVVHTPGCANGNRGGSLST